MPIESIQTPKAPEGWAPTPDQQRRIQSDPRLRRLSRDELYFVFNKRPTNGARKASPAPESRSTNSSGLGAVLGRVTRAMRGDQ